MLVVGDELQVHRVREGGLDLAPARVRRREAVDEDIGPHLIGTRISESDERVRIADRQLLEQQPVDRAEQRGVGADAEREGDEDDGGPALGPQEHARGEAKILQHRVSPSGAFARQLLQAKAVLIVRYI